MDPGSPRVCVPSPFSRVQLGATPLTVARQASLARHGILQVIILEGVAMPSSRGSSPPRDWTCVPYILLYWQASSLLLAPPRKPRITTKVRKSRRGSQRDETWEGPLCRCRLWGRREGYKPGYRQPLEAGKGKELDSSLELQEEWSPACTLMLAQWDPLLGVRGPFAAPRPSHWFLRI